MDEEKLDVSVFEKAIITFKNILDRHRKEQFEDDAVRDACIQRFEYCYDFSKKILIKHLKNIGEDSVDNKSLAEVIRVGAKKGLLLNSWDIWSNYLENRNRTSHGYDENIAKKIVEEIPSFLIEIEYLLEKLKNYYEI